MKKTLKRALAILSAAALLGCAASAEYEYAKPMLPAGEVEIMANVPKIDHGYIVGEMTVKENSDTIVGEDDTHLYKADGAFVLNDKGQALTFEDIKPGDKLTYYVDGNAPMTLQLPVHYSPAAVVVATENSYVNQVIGVFDEDGLANDESLKLNYDLSTPYFSHTREAAFISGKALVLYENTTRSIPPQTSPAAIVKLTDDEPEAVPPFMGHGPQIADTDAYISGSLAVDENGETLAGKDGAGEEIHLYKNENTLIINKQGEEKTFADIKAGDSLIYYVSASEPMTLQLPVHYTAEVIVIDDGSDVNVLLGNFDAELLDAVNSLVLHIGENTKIYGADGFNGGTALALYNFATMSIPAQTTPIAVVVMANQPQAPTPADVAPDLSGVRKIVAGDSTLGYIPVTVNGVQMLPVREVAEALGYSVDWIEESQTVTVGFASFTVDQDAYAFAKMAPQALGQAPVLIAMPGDVYAKTYVPAIFFTAVMDGRMTVDGDTLIINAAE